MRKIYHLEVPNRIKKSNPDFRTSTALSTGSDDYFFLRYPHFGHTPSSLSATPHSGQRSMSCLGTNSTKAVHSSKTANEKKTHPPALAFTQKHSLCSWSHAPPATRSSEGKEPTEIGLRTRTLHFSRKSGSEKERQKTFYSFFTAWLLRH